MEEKILQIVKNGMNDCLEQRNLTWEKATKKQFGRALVEFYLREVGQFLFPIYEGDIEDGLDCDGKGDLNVDFASSQDNNNYIILQSKFKGANNRLNTDEISGFFRIHERLLDKEFFENHANVTLRDLLRDFNEDSTVQYIFLTNDKASDRIIDEFTQCKQDYESRYSNTSYELKSLTEIKKDYRTVGSQIEMIPEEVTINIEPIYDTLAEREAQAYLDVSSLIDPEQKYKSILCTIKGTTLKNLWEQHPSDLFNYNIRGYLGENPINKKMKQTLEQEPEKFYFFNNGISAICTDISPAMNTNEATFSSIKCKNFQIINGTQTVTTIGRFKDKEKLKQVRVLLKITKGEDLKKKKVSIRKSSHLITVKQ